MENLSAGCGGPAAEGGPMEKTPPPTRFKSRATGAPPLMPGERSVARTKRRLHWLRETNRPNGRHLKFSNALEQVHQSKSCGRHCAPPEHETYRVGRDRPRKTMLPGSLL